MYKNDAKRYPYPSRRELVFGREAIAASGNPYASQVGLDILRAGGNAVDAALAMAMVHVVVEPTNNGLGSDAFVLLSMDGEVYGLNASGPAPKALTSQVFWDRGYKAIPQEGPLVSVVPGAVGGWMALYDRFASWDLEDLAQPAINLAREGYALSPAVAWEWAKACDRFKKYQGQAAYQGFFDNFTQKGRPPQAGDRVRLPQVARSLEAIAKTRGQAFYQGQMAQDLVAFLKKEGGLMSLEDLASYQPQWVQPRSSSFRGLEVWELPPNGHGVTVLMALEIFKALEEGAKTPEERTHLAIEALKLAYVDVKAYVAEPSRMDPGLDQLLDPAYLAHRASLIGDKALDPQVGRPQDSSTVYFNCGDREGNMVSFIQSNYNGFGSGLVLPGWGLSLNNRVNNFYLEPGLPNSLVGGTRPYHTIIPGFLTKEGDPYGAFGVMGAFMQPQGQFQVLLRLLDQGLNPQSALDAPRWQWLGDREVSYEENYEPDIIGGLSKRGHQVHVEEDMASMGRGQVILKNPQGGYLGGTEPRTDGTILGW
ncbi:MAG: gamma-glutamyltransferase family protein [Tissierellia bacterium]|nr:gamma-glutamyltransferase family protein [Tissierellia bacterium]